MLIGAFVFLILRGLAIALEAPTLFARLLAGAVSMMRTIKQALDPKNIMNPGKIF